MISCHAKLSSPAAHLLLEFCVLDNGVYAVMFSLCSLGIFFMKPGDKEAYNSMFSIDRLVSLQRLSLRFGFPLY